LFQYSFLEDFLFRKPTKELKTIALRFPKFGNLILKKVAMLTSRCQLSFFILFTGFCKLIASACDYANSFPESELIAKVA